MQQERVGYQEPYPEYLSQQYEAHRDRIHPIAYRVSVAQSFRKVIFIGLSIFALVVIASLLLTIRSMNAELDRLQHAIQADSHVCGVTYVRGTPVTLKTYVRYSTDAQGNVSKWTVCG